MTGGLSLRVVPAEAGTAMHMGARLPLAAPASAGATIIFGAYRHA
jgi:hypothetical protein